MKAILAVDCMKYSAWFTYSCQECGNKLTAMDDGSLEHPAFDGTSFFGKGKPIKCSRIGARFEKPVHAIELKPIP